MNDEKRKRLRACIRSLKAVREEIIAVHVLEEDAATGLKGGVRQSELEDNADILGEVYPILLSVINVLEAVVGDEESGE